MRLRDIDASVVIEAWKLDAIVNCICSTAIPIRGAFAGAQGVQRLRNARPCKARRDVVDRLRHAAGVLGDAPVAAVLHTAADGIKHLRG